MRLLRGGFDEGEDRPDGRVEHHGETVHGGSLGVPDEPATELPQPRHADVGVLSGLGEGPAHLAAAGFDALQEGCGASHEGYHVAESSQNRNSPLASVAESSYSYLRQEHEPGVIDQDAAGLAGPVTVRNETVSTDTRPVAQEQCCRTCGEPLSLLELREQQCTECEDAERERLREEAAEGHWADLADEREFNRRYGA